MMQTKVLVFDFQQLFVFHPGTSDRKHFKKNWGKTGLKMWSQNFEKMLNCALNVL